MQKIQSKIKALLILGIILLAAGFSFLHPEKSAAQATPTPVDTEVPVVQITSPVNGSTVSGIVHIEATASDNVGISKVEFYAVVGNQTPLINTDTTAPYTADWDSTQAANAAGRSIYAYAYDQRNNSATASVTVTISNVVLGPSATPTPDPSATPSATATPSPTQCSSLSSETDTQTQVQIIEANTSCIPEFIAFLKNNPNQYLQAFYQLVQSPSVTDELFSVVYEEVRNGRFRFSGSVFEDMLQNFPLAVDACTGNTRCIDWKNFILPNLYNGNMYVCPSDVATLSAAELLQNVPYGDYYCTESIAQALAPLANDSTVQSLLSIINTNNQALARRNAIRVIGRFAELPSSSPAYSLVTSTYSAEVKNTLLTRLQADTAENVLHDASWVLDTFFFPFYESQQPLEVISKNTSFSSSLRFRAITAAVRLILGKNGIISGQDLDYLLQSLRSDDMWQRAEAAYSFETIKSEKLDSEQRTRIISELQLAYQVEQQLAAKVYIARALDRFNGNTALFDGLKNSYESAHLANQISEGSLSIRSGLAQDQLYAFLTKMKNVQAAFFQIMGSEFSTPIPNDKNESLTLMLFATNQEYVDYMNSFIGDGAYAGGLYLSDEGKIYTYQRTPAESIFTVEELIQHEFGHFLLDRFVFPGSFSTPGYFNEPKAWIDEGTAEFFAGMVFNGNGDYTVPLRQVSLSKICGQSFRDLSSLLSQTEGYSDPGIFDYNNGWAFTYYLLLNRKPAADNLFTSFRNNTYNLDSFSTIAGVSSVSALESDWHVAMQSWCTGGAIPTPTYTQILPTSTPTPTYTPTPTPTSTPTPTPTFTPTPTPSDVIPPVVNITKPLNNAKVAKNKTTVIQATATDASGILKVEFSVDGVLKCTDSVAAYTCSWLVPAQRGIKYIIQAKAYDTKGNSAARSISVTSN